MLSVTKEKRKKEKKNIYIYIYTHTHTHTDQDFPSHRGWLQPKGNLIPPMKSNSH